MLKVARPSSTLTSTLTGTISWTVSSSLENLALSCFSLPLKFIPYQLTHCEVGELAMWLLGGSDKRMHIYNEDKANYM